MSTKEKIKETAAMLFAEYGFKGMTIKQIADEVGIKPPSVYAFYKNKNDIFLAIYREALDGHLSTVESQIKENISAKSQLYSIMKSAVDYQFEEDLETKLLIRLMIFPPEFLKEELNERFNELEQHEFGLLYKIFHHGINQGEIKDTDCNPLALSFICLMDGIFWQMQRHSPEEVYKRLDILFNQFWSGITLKG